MRRYLEEQARGGRLYNSILIQSNDVKTTLAELQDFIRKYLLTEKIDLASHPEFKLVSSENGEDILIDQIRELRGFLYKTPSIAASKVAVIVPADLMNKNAANSCLKILEDTPKNTYLFLIANNIAGILPTVRSRCVKIRHAEFISASHEILKQVQDEGLYEKHIKIAGGLDEKALLDFLQELSSKNKELWLGFAKNIHFLVTKLAKKASGIKLDLNSTEEQIRQRFGNISASGILEKAERINKIIKDTVKYDLDLRANFLLIVAVLLC